MFLLDLYRFCESREKFNRQELARFIFRHRECERLAKNAGVTPRYFASSSSKEFIARMMGYGYLDGVHCVYWCKNKMKRPFNFELHSLEGDSNRYVWEMMNIEKMSDEELFSKPAFDRSYFERKFSNANSA
ncbi:hypothetical protein PJM39_0070 [Salmonella phage vB_SenS_UTK0006]|uniref:HTH domain-containing protein n=2 Tax=Tlsvirus TaxID=1920865 RepID=A5PJ28_9CAUD|nr:gp70 [Escherichia phage Tls]AAR09301.1 HTH domain-containing protein [Escherichia phage Tls]WDR21563.1 hypothetical protein PJM39_0070 [Salmonella phage vB_SenS_UTK0006]HAC8812693.1 hypothetical protein [Salmonella enterica]HAS2179703.1 hypothetical protein [Salmonella enterica subsp. enterica]